MPRLASPKRLKPLPALAPRAQRELLTRGQIMARIRGRDTAPERAVRASLRRLGVPISRGWRTGRTRLVGRPDFILASSRIVLFVHGCFWHRHFCLASKPRCSAPKTNAAFWRAKFEANTRRDRRVAKALRRAGWRVLTVWECQIGSDDQLDALLSRKLARPKRARRGREGH